MTLQKGDFILIDYVAKVKETNEVFDTTKMMSQRKSTFKQRRTNP
jgi:FKBP-type peptidyl-prolyl cis-trans isomerase 2